PMPWWASGITATHLWTKGMLAMFLSCFSAPSSSGTPTVHALMGTPESVAMILYVVSMMPCPSTRPVPAWIRRRSRASAPLGPSPLSGRISGLISRRDGLQARRRPRHARHEARPPQAGRPPGRVAPHRVRLPAGRPPRPPLRALAPARGRGARRGRARRCPPRLAGDRGARRPLRARRPLGLRGGVRKAPRLRARLSLRARARGLPRPHHHGHPRRPDLHAPPHRD